MPPSPGYTFLSLSAARSILSGRLQDPFSNSYWTVTEVNAAINEALQAWQAYTASYRQRVTFSTSVNTPFYDLPTVASPTAALVYSVSDQDIANSIMAFLLEPPVTATWTGTGQFTFAEIMAAIQSRLNRFLGDTDCVITRITPAFGETPPIDRTFLPENTLDVRRAAWSSNSPGTPGALWGMSGSVSFPQIVQVDETAGVIITQFTAPHKPSGHYSPNPNFGNGTGLTVDLPNQLIYYGYSGSLMAADCTNVYLTNFAGTDLGVFFDMIGVFSTFGGILTLVLDGTSIWVTDATPVPFNNPYAWQIDIPTRTLLRRVTLGPVGGPPFAPGLAYVNTQVTPNIVLLQPSNHGSKFDLYHLSGTTLTLITASFIDGNLAGFGTLYYGGVAFDGTHYIISNYASASGPNPTQNLLFFNATTGAFVSKTVTVPPAPQAQFGWNLQGISQGTAQVPGSTGPTTPMFRDDDFATQAYFLTGINSPVNPPQVFTMFNLPPVGLRVFPPPSQVGGLDLLILQAGVTVGTSPAAVFNTPVILNVPDDLTWGIKFGALADLLSGDGPTRDPERAAYCEQRYMECVALARLNPSVLLTEVNSNLIWTGNSIFEMDAFSNNWQNTTGAPTTAGMGGRNMLAFSPVADNIYPVAMDVAGNIPRLVLDSDFLQVDRGNIDPVLNYAQHLLCFKMAGAEFQATTTLYRNFVEAVKLENSRLANLATYADPMTSTDRKQEGSMFRVTLPSR